MEPRTPKKSHHCKKCKTKTQERFAKNFPYRFSWLTEPNPEPLQPWEVRDSSEKDQLPLQKKLVPTRSIPVPGVGAPDFTPPANCYPPPPLCKLWELKLLGLRFPEQVAPRADGSPQRRQPPRDLRGDPASQGPPRDPA